MAFPAQCFNDAGIGFAVFDFNGVDETGGDLWPLLNQVISALAWLPRNAAELGGDPDRLFVAGFSSGAHLAAVAMTTDWQAQGFAANPYQGAVLISGMYDLRAVRLSKRSEYVTFTDEVEHSMSVQRHLERYQLPTVLAYGMYETPEFQRQTCEFSAALRAAGKPVQLLAEKGCNHVEMMESLGNPYSLVGQATLNLIASQSRQRKSS
jgi:arylformamidase